MNILEDKDLKEYMLKKQMYATKEIVDINTKTIFKEKTVYFIHGISIEWVNNDTVLAYIFAENGIECSFTRTCSKLAFYSEIKKLFIPVDEMYQKWKRS